MPDLSIQTEFVNGVQEIFDTLFNKGDDNTDGVQYYPLSPLNTVNVYREQAEKLYKEPVLLTCKATLNPAAPDNEAEQLKSTAQFKVPLKSLLDNGLSVDSLQDLCKGLMKFHGVYYVIDQITPQAYVENVFLFYEFSCTETSEKSEEESPYHEGEQVITVYAGEVDVTPKIDEDTTLGTASRFVTEDINVRKVPMSQVSNQSGGVTLNIGG